MSITGNELENIFIPEKRKICQTCHKIRIKTLISKYNFNEDHQENICFCQNSQNRQQQNHHQIVLQIQQDEDQQINQDEEQQIPVNEEQQIQQDEEGDQYLTKKEFDQFKEQINQFKDDINKKFEDLSKLIQGLYK